MELPRQTCGKKEREQEARTVTAAQPARTHRHALLWGWQTDPCSTAALRPEPLREPHAVPLCTPVRPDHLIAGHTPPTASRLLCGCEGRGATKAVLMADTESYPHAGKLGSNHSWQPWL